ncbi:MAG: ATP-binding protein [Acidobacteriota bacterium]|nr:ATP-binding protein [Acidobacteriota bacterium]
MSAEAAARGESAERLRAAGAEGDVLEELLRYDTPLLPADAVAAAAAADYPDEPFVAVWEEYARDAGERGAVAALAARLPQMRFPVRAGVSATEEYRAATRRGETPPEGEAPFFANPSDITLTLHPTLAGRLPVLVANERADFETLVRVFSARSEPVPVPPSMGACLVKGFNNWDRVARFRRSWEGEHGAGDWAEEGFPALLAEKALYEDRFMILSAGPYSGVPAREAGFEPDAWATLSVAIRRDHECTHYATLRAAGATRVNLLDEVVADYVGLVRTFGRFRGDLARLFLGLERFPAYREGARLENYRGTPPLSPGALSVLKTVCHDALLGLEAFDSALPEGARSERGLLRATLALAATPLSEMGGGGAAERLLLAAGFVTRAFEPDATQAGDAPWTVETVDLGARLDRDAVERAASLLGAFAARHGVPRRPVADLAIAIDELVSNVAKYGGRAGAPPPAVSLEFGVRAGALEVEIADSGAPFDPLSGGDPDVSGALDERPIGGLGLHLVRKLADQSRYERRDGRNVVRLVRRF